MALLDDLGPLGRFWQFGVSAWSDPAGYGGAPGVQQFLSQLRQQVYAAQGEIPPALQYGQWQQFISSTAAVGRSTRQLQADIRQVQLTGIDQALTAAHIAPAIDSRPLSQTGGLRNHRITFQADMTIGGIPTSQWFTWEAGIAPPATIQELLDQLNQAGQSFGERYDMSYEGLGSVVQITSW